jgi:hypothetical protein
MRKLHKSLSLLAAGMLLGALGAHAQGSFSNSVSRAADRSASRSAGRGSVSSASSTAVAERAGTSGGGSGAGGHAGGMSSLASASLTPARIASFCGRQASNSRAASACSSAGYTRPAPSSFAGHSFSAPAGMAAAASASGMDGDGPGFAADDMMGGPDAFTGDDALGGDALGGDSLGGEGDVSLGHAARPAPHSHSSHEQPAAAARYAHAGQRASRAASGSRKRRPY